MNRPENYSTEPASLLTDEELIDTHEWIVYEDGDGGNRSTHGGEETSPAEDERDRSGELHTFGGGSYESDLNYPPKRRAALEAELDRRGIEYE